MTTDAALLPLSREFEAGLPREWCRGPQWKSEADRATWAPVLEEAQRAWEMIELASVTDGLATPSAQARARSSALVFLTLPELVRASADCAANGLELTPLAAAGPVYLRAAVHLPGLSTEWRDAWSASDDDAIGSLLGFPECCRQFFRREWSVAGRRDVTPAMRSVEGPWPANTMLRWLGVRLVPHLPCSADCAETVAAAWRNLATGRRSGANVAALEQLLRLPVRYELAGGLAIVETPHFRFMASADYAPTPVCRVRAGSPAEDASWPDNGFSSEHAMEEAHRVVAEASCASEFQSALDLGCGDGSLLALLARLGGPGPWVGVESDAVRAARGRLRHAPRVDVRHGRIEDTGLWAHPTDLALLMPGRLLEMPPLDRLHVSKSVREFARRVVFYAYGDVLSRHGGLVSVCSAAGASVSGPVFYGPGVQAAEGKL